MLYGINENEEVCANCTHYYQHYVKDPFWTDEQYAPCNCGHCVRPRMKVRKPGMEACEHFEKK